MNMMGNSRMGFVRIMISGLIKKVTGAEERRREEGWRRGEKISQQNGVNSFASVQGGYNLQRKVRRELVDGASRKSGAARDERQINTERG
jgi:hypothetical protein